MSIPHEGPGRSRLLRGTAWLAVWVTAAGLFASGAAHAEAAPRLSHCSNRTLQMANGEWVLWGNNWTTFGGLSTSDVYQGVGGDGRVTPRRYESIESLFASTPGGNSPSATRIFCNGSNVRGHAALSDGTIAAWGSNSYGELGVGDTNSRTTPTGVVFLSGQVADIQGGDRHTVALMADGTVHAWGTSANGQVGDGSTSPARTQPTQLMELSGVRAIAAGANHTLALMADGTVRSWGYNYYGQLGYGNTTTGLRPGLVVGLTNVVAIAAGENFSLALKADGTVWGWGYSYYGETGTTATSTVLSPAQATTLSGIVQIAASSNTGFAIDNLGRVWGWGYNRASRTLLGENRTNCSTDCAPEVIPGLPSNITKIYPSGDSAFAWAADGRLFGWGGNYNEDLGLGITYTYSSWIPATATPQLVRLGVTQNDLDRDFSSDILFRNTQSGDIWLWNMKESAIRESNGIGSVSTDWQIVGVGDANGDGHDDLFWRNSVTGGNAIWIMKNRQLDRALTLDTVGDANWKVLALADLNGDGRADMIWRNEAAGLWAAWLIGDSGVLQARAYGGVPSDWEIRGAADFTGDTRADLIWRHKTSGAVVIYRMEGLTISGVNFLAGGLAEWDIVAVTDTDRDTRAELLFRNSTGSALAEVQLNDAATAISSTRFLPAAGGAWNVAAVGDYDGDTHTDILWRNAAGELVIWRLVDMVLPGANSVERFTHVKFLGNPGNVWQVIGK